MSTLPPVIFLLGPTAAGKTAVAMELVRRFPADIISVDSAMIYSGMDIGTAKPTPQELAAAPHALIDIIDPAAAWSVGEFCERAYGEIAASHQRSRLPILTGGTMMYFRALEHGLAELPARDIATRSIVDEMAQDHGWPHVHAELGKVDPAAAGRIHPNDAQRLQRALEVFLLTGKPLSELQKETARPCPYPLVKIALLPDDRETLHDRIEQRFGKMLDAGFLDEVRSLFERSDLHARLPSMRTVGYRQLWAHLAGKVSLSEACENAKTATRQLAKRQLTWIRSDRHLELVKGEHTAVCSQIETLIGEITGIRP